MARFLLLAFAMVALVGGCQSISDVDLSAKDSDCTQTCLSRHRICDNRITMMPIRQHNDCADNLRYCVQDCPVKGASKITTIEAPEVQLEAMAQAKKKCSDLGFKAGTESFGQCVLKIAK